MNNPVVPNTGDDNAERRQLLVEEVNSDTMSDLNISAGGAEYNARMADVLPDGNHKI